MRELGLFMDAIEPFHFIGFYVGDWKEARRPYRGTNRHVFEADGYHIFPCLAATEQPICRVNEPPHGTTANCAFVRFVHEAEVVPGGRRSVKITAVWCARATPALR